MKKAYNETWVTNLAIEKTAAKWLSQKLISEEQFASVKENFPSNFYRPSQFIKIGLFLFACIACSFFTGLLTIMFMDSGQYAYVPICLLSFAGFMLMLNQQIRNRRLFHSGVDNALLYASITSLFICLFSFFDNRLEVWQYCLIILLVLSLAIYYYADLICSIAFFATYLVLPANLMLQSAMGKMLLPFAIMIMSVLIYGTAEKVTLTYYQNCRKIFKLLSLICFYLGGNYLVVRETNALLMDIPGTTTSPQISFAPLFWLFTITIPSLYFIYGLRNKNRMLLLTGLICLGFSAYTFLFYNDFLTLAQTLIAAGVFMILFAVCAVRYLKVPRHGISDQLSGDIESFQLESLFAAQFSNHNSTGNIDSGDGSFSGAGAGGDY